MEIDFSTVAGTLAYPAFNPAVNVATADLPVLTSLPLCVTMDFNVAPMILEVGQMVNGKALVLAGEVAMNPASIPAVIDEFRNRFPSHPAGLQIYGDGTGRGRSPQTAQSHWDLVRLSLSTYPSRVSWMVSKANPAVMDRVNATNYKLRGHQGAPGLLISPSCRELIADYAEVILDDDGRDIKKVNSETDPYSKRTHASDAIGYWIYREWPLVLAEAPKPAGKVNRPRPRLNYGRLPGDL